MSFSESKKTPWQRGAGSFRARRPYGNLTEGASESPPRHSPKHLLRSGSGRPEKSRLLKIKVFSGRAGDTPGATCVARQPSLAILPASPRPAPPPSPAPGAALAYPRRRAVASAFAPARLLALAHAHAAPGRPRRCHGGGEQLKWARGQPREQWRGKLRQ